MSENENSMRNIISKYLGWCPGVNLALKLSEEKPMWGKNLIILITAIVLITYGGAYLLWLQPDPEPEPLVIKIDGQDVSNVDFESYDFSNFYGKKVTFELPIAKDEFAPAGTNNYQKTIYEYETWDEAFQTLSEFEVPEIVICFAKWLRNGTRLEVQQKYGSTGSLEHYFGTNIHMSTCTFTVIRAQEIYPHFYEFGTSERIVIEKNYQSSPTRGMPIWIFAVKLSDDPPYQVMMIRFTG
jgi:hypothetical protein